MRHLVRQVSLFIAGCLALYQISLMMRCVLPPTQGIDSFLPSPDNVAATERKATKDDFISLLDLIETHRETSCPRKLMLVNDTLLDDASSLAVAGNRRIPRIVHVTAKSRCMTPEFADTLDKWQQLSNHSFFVHNDAAMERLLQKYWPEFPQLQKALQCSVSMAAKADVWRALVLWEYGGIYTDIDNAPGSKFNATTIGPTDDAFFVIEGGGFLSQYFMAASPKHPLMYLLVQTLLHRLYDQYDVQNQYVPYVTGPGALKSAFVHFMQAQGQNLPSMKQSPQPQAFQRIQAGFYVGLDNRSVTVVGRANRPNEYVQRSVIYQKRRIYNQMGMTHFSRIKRMVSNESCIQRLYRLESSRRRRSNDTDTGPRPYW